MIVLIPSYEPTQRLLEVVGGLRDAAPGIRIVVVDDGSGPGYAPIFSGATALSAEVIGYGCNRGKGSALKTGFAHIAATYPARHVVTADSDGQHTVADILRVAERLRTADDASAIVLGTRRFVGAVPARSRFGNAVSSALFRMSAGFPVSDTQTGLRGFPAGSLEWLQSVGGTRFEYELNVLLESRTAGHPIEELAIETVYLDHNASSHFRPIRDSLRVLRPMLRFAASSLAAFAVDLGMLQLLFWATGSLLASVIGARVVSASLNFAVNRRLVFGSDASERPGGLRRAILRYALLAIALLATNYVWLSALTAVGLPLLVAKVITEVTLYLVSFSVQRSVVFARSIGKASSVHRERIAADREMDAHRAAVSSTVGAPTSTSTTSRSSS